MPRRLRVALLIESSRASGRALLGGIADYARAHGPWSFYHHERALADAAPARLRDWRGDGVIARIESPKLIRQLRRLGLPTVDVLGWHTIPGVPAFGNDRRAIVRLAVGHFLQRGLRSFAYCGYPGVAFSDDRSRHFVAELGARGHQAHVFDRVHAARADFATVEAQGLLHERSLVAWLRSLPKPVGLLASNDIRARQVLTVCGDHGIEVPDDVAVLGVDNDELLCELCDPPLSSVAVDNQWIGYQAAAVLHRMIAGMRVPQEKTLVPPLHVMTRKSTDILAIDDGDVAQAVRFIQENATQRITVDDVVRRVMLSPSTLKRRFAKILGHSPKEEILRVQIRRVQELLSTTSLPLAEVAVLAGFEHVEWMCKLFRQRVGCTPGQYRSRSRPDAPGPRPSAGPSPAQAEPGCSDRSISSR